MDTLPTEIVDKIMQLLSLDDKLRFMMCDQWLYATFYDYLFAHKLRFRRCLNYITIDIKYESGVNDDDDEFSRVTVSDIIIIRWFCRRISHTDDDKGYDGYAISYQCRHRQFRSTQYTVTVYDGDVDRPRYSDVCNECFYRCNKTVDMYERYPDRY